MPTVQSYGRLYAFQATPMHETTGEREMKRADPSVTATRTISHAHAQIVDGLPVRKGLDDRVLAAVVLGIVVVVVLEVMPHKELAFALRAQEQAQAKVMDDAPGQRVYKVESQGALDRECGKESERKAVEDNQHEHGVRRSVRAGVMTRENRRLGIGRMIKTSARSFGEYSRYAP